ncbi:MAG: hypothetical protein M3P91_13325 [Actinomycetota bacterium]|nr:hypothetical protein [Actinomycetota bacterium]
MAGQLSLFSADTQRERLTDLEGLLPGPAQVVRRGGAARISVVLPRPDPWRRDALLDGLTRLGVGAEVVQAARETGRPVGVAVRTDFAADLEPIARRWSRGAAKHPPDGFYLDGPRLRWWCLSSGWPDGVGWMLRLDPLAAAGWPDVAAALSSAGLPCTLVGRRAGGPACRLVGSRRLRRLAELVGTCPPGAPEDDWPPGAGGSGSARPAPVAPGTPGTEDQH